MIKAATLRLMTNPLTKTKPVSFDVMVDGKVVAVVPLGEIKQAAEHIARLERGQGVTHPIKNRLI